MRRSNLKIKGQRLKIKVTIGIVLTCVLAFAFLAFVFFKVVTLDKFIYVNKTSDGGAEIIVVDTKSDEILKYKIPANVELESSNGYGKYKLSSLWILSQKDENKGRIISDTILKNYSLPVYLWRSCSSRQSWISWTNNCDSNLNLYQRIYSLFLKKGKISYEAEINSPKVNNTILINFVNPKFSDKVLKVDIEDLTNSADTIGHVSKIIEIIGGKITNNSKGYNKDLDCEVIGSDVEVIQIFSKLFKCNEIYGDLLTADLKIRLGAKFTERF